MVGLDDGGDDRQAQSQAVAGGSPAGLQALEGLRESGVSLDDRFVVETEFTRAGGYAAARELAGRGLEGIEVVFAVNDVMAIGAMTAFRDAGLVPGADLAVAGFDDIASAVDVVPALTPAREHSAPLGGRQPR